MNEEKHHSPSTLVYWKCKGETTYCKKKTERYPMFVILQMYTETGTNLRKLTKHKKQKGQCADKPKTITRLAVRTVTVKQQWTVKCSLSRLNLPMAI